jgi:hypothetical protein
VDLQKRAATLAVELMRMGHSASHRMVDELPQEMEYSLQANRKTLEGSAHPDRDAQFSSHQQQDSEIPTRLQKQWTGTPAER